MDLRRLTPRRIVPVVGLVLRNSTGNLNPLLYRFYRTDPGLFFHDITGIGPHQAVATNNGLFPALPGYDLATGIGTPKMAPLITLGR